MLARLLEHFESEGDDKKLEIIKQVSPLARHNIKMRSCYRLCKMKIKSPL